MRVEDVISELRSHANPRNVEGMARFGISSKNTLGLSIPTLRNTAKKIGTDHALAQALWKSGIHEARILAAFVDDPAEVTEAQMEEWVSEFDSWDVCDQVCGGLFDRTPFAHRKALEWSRRREEFVRRAAFALMAALSVHDKGAPDSAFLKFLGPIEKASTDPRNFVKKAVNWALRQIGKRNLRLNRAALECATRISRIDSPSAKWVAADAIRELKSDAVQKRIRRSS